MTLGREIEEARCFENGGDMLCLEHVLPAIDGQSGRLGVLGKSAPKRDNWRWTAQEGQRSVEVSLAEPL